MTLLITLLLLMIGVGYGVSAMGGERVTVAEFDLKRYMGDWYEIARFDHSFERGLIEVKASYRLLPNGRVEVVNSGHKRNIDRQRTARGKAYATSIPGQLKVSFFLFLYSEYNVMELDEEYQWALVGSRSPKYLWILSRTPRLSGSTLNHILALARKHGYDTDKLLFIDQSAAQR